MLFHQLGQHFVLPPQLGFQRFDPLPLPLLPTAGPLRRRQGRRPVLKKLLQPAVENRGMNARFLTDAGNRHFLDQVPPQDGDFLFSRAWLGLPFRFAHVSPPL